MKQLYTVWRDETFRVSYTVYAENPEEAIEKVEKGEYETDEFEFAPCINVGECTVDLNQGEEK